MTVLGQMLVLLALVLAGIACAGYFLAGRSGVQPSLRIRRTAAGSSFLLVAASLVLLVLFLRHDFSNGYVYNYSDRSLPLHFLISSFYAGQEGSFLFWALCSGVIALFLMRSARARKTEAWVMGPFMAVHCFLVLLVAVKSPFTSLWSMFPDAPAGIIPADGHGLNPLLQNFWMVIHPPVLFAGFALMAVPFSMAIAGLWKKEYHLLSSQAFSWLLLGTSVLGLGIMLGAYWAYGVLGWGGYWGWDPVENSSLIPWLTSVALLHMLLAHRRTGKYTRTNYVLAITSFLLVIYSTFLTRSGILGDASVHAFTDPGATVYWLLLVFQGMILGAGLGLLLWRRHDLRPSAPDGMMLTRETSLGAGSIALLLSAAVTLFGTSLPIFSKTRVEPSFYDATNFPIAIAMVLLIGFSLYTQWQMQDGRALLRRSVTMVTVSLLIAAVLFFLGMRDAMPLLLVSGAAFALLVNIEIAVKVARGNPRFLGGKLAHIGIALFLVGVISTGRYGTTQQLVLPLNTPREGLGHVLTYTGSTPTADGKFRFHVTVEGTEGTYTLSPVMFEAPQQGVMRNPDIASFLTRDLYISPVSVEALQPPGTAGTGPYRIQKGETVSLGASVRATFVSFDMSAHDAAPSSARDGAMRVGSVLRLSDGSAQEMITPVAMYGPGDSRTYEPVHSRLLNADVRLLGMDIGMGTAPSAVTLEVRAAGGAPSPREALVVDASVKPFINLLWGGTLVMLAGFALSIVKWAKEG